MYHLLKSTAIWASSTMLVWALVSTFSTNTAHASLLQNPALRMQLAQTYAPEIRQDRDEEFGLASVSYFLRRATFHAVVTRCSALGRGYPTVKIAPGTALLFTSQLKLVHPSSSCRRTFGLFLTKNKKEQGTKLLAAPNRVFLRLHKHNDALLLRKAFRHAITPEIYFHAYEVQNAICRKRSLIGLCKDYKTQRHYIIQYFVALMYNKACNLHEGEQEGLVIHVDANAFDNAKTPQQRQKAIQKIGLYGHYHTKLFQSHQLKFAQDTHPIVYMGAGGHALYPAPGSTSLAKSYPLELRKGIQRVCKRRGRYQYLYEQHRGGGPVYQTWLPPQGPLQSPKQVEQLLPTPSKQEQTHIAQTPGLQAQCLLARKTRGIRLCDVRPSAKQDPCCLKQTHLGLVRWVQYTGRWGKQEKFASGLIGATTAQAGRLLKRWPLGRSTGNSGPFGPRFIHQSTWNWLNPAKKPAATSPVWR